MTSHVIKYQCLRPLGHDLLRPIPTHIEGSNNFKKIVIALIHTTKPARCSERSPLDSLPCDISPQMGHAAPFGMDIPPCDSSPPLGQAAPATSRPYDNSPSIDDRPPCDISPLWQLALNRWQAALRHLAPINFFFNFFSIFFKFHRISQYFTEFHRISYNFTEFCGIS